MEQCYLPNLSTVRTNQDVWTNFLFMLPLSQTLVYKFHLHFSTALCTFGSCGPCLPITMPYYCRCDLSNLLSSGSYILPTTGHPTILSNHSEFKRQIFSTIFRVKWQVSSRTDLCCKALIKQSNWSEQSKYYIFLLSYLLFFISPWHLSTQTTPSFRPPPTLRIVPLFQ